MNEKTLSRFKQLYRQFGVISNYNILLFIATFYSQSSYRDYYLKYVFFASILISGFYIAVVFSKNKGLSHFCMEKADMKNIRAAVLAMPYVALSLVSFTISGYVAYMIQNILYVAAFIVLLLSLIIVRVKA